MYLGLVMYGVLSYYRRQWSFQCMRGEAEWMRTRLGMWWSFKPVLSWGSSRGLAQNSTEWVCPSLISTFSCSLTFYINQEPKPCKRLADYFPIAQAVIHHEYIMSLLPWEPKQDPQILSKVRLRQLYQSNETYLLSWMWMMKSWEGRFFSTKKREHSPTFKASYKLSFWTFSATSWN